jgi:hypothetical protein
MIWSRLGLVLFFNLGLGVATAAWAQDAMPDLPVPETKKSPSLPSSPAGAPLPPAASPSGVDEELTTNWVVLGGLDKLTARVVTIEAEVGSTTRFGQLEIIARTCRQRGPEAASPESAAFLDIWDMKPGQPAKSVFRGWMFASSPALSAMEHPIYDVWVLTCKSKAH